MNKAPITLAAKYLNPSFPEVLLLCVLRTIIMKYKLDYFADKGPYSQSYGFSSGQVWM